MQQVTAGPDGGVDDLLDVEERRGPGPVEGQCRVGAPDVRGVGLVRGVHRDRTQPAGARGADDAQRDLAPVGDQQARHQRTSGTLGQRARAADRSIFRLADKGNAPSATTRSSGTL